MSVLIDTNVMLDIALKREPFFQNSALALAKARAAGHTQLCATSITTLHYFMHKTLGEAGARRFIANCLQAMTLAQVQGSTLQKALASPMQDFEDGVIAHCAAECGAHTILTRDTADYANSPVPALTPTQYLSTP
nr:PIN domain-containing protein [Rhodoferax sp.]